MDVDGGEIDLDLLPALSVLLEERNVTWAAQRLGITQSSLSAKLAKLRRALGDPLLVPAAEGRGMILTARAAALQAPWPPPSPRCARRSARPRRSSRPAAAGRSASP